MEFFYTTRSTSRSISTLLCVIILQRSSSTRQGAPVGVYLHCCVCKYCRGALLQDKEHHWGISTLLCVVILQRRSSTRQGAPVGVYLSCCVCKYCRGALLNDKEHQWEYTYPVLYVNTAQELFDKTRSTSRGIYPPCCVCKYCRGALLEDKKYQ